MAEIYQPDDNPIMSYPSVSDNSLDMDLLVKFFSRKFRHHCTSCVNRYLFSFGNDFVCIVPIRSSFRVIGRLDNFQFIKRSQYFDTFFTGDFDSCLKFYKDILSSYVLHFSNGSS